MLIGYARVSTDDQDLALQRAALKDVGCKRVYEEKVTGAKRDRPQLVRMLDQLRFQAKKKLFRQMREKTAGAFRQLDLHYHDG